MARSNPGGRGANAPIVGLDRYARRGIPRRACARLVTDALTPYVLLAETLGELHAQLPPGLERSDHQPADPPEVVEIRFQPSGRAPAPARSWCPRRFALLDSGNDIGEAIFARILNLPDYRRTPIVRLLLREMADVLSTPHMSGHDDRYLCPSSKATTAAEGAARGPDRSDHRHALAEARPKPPAELPDDPEADARVAAWFMVRQEHASAGDLNDTLTS